MDAQVHNSTGTDAGAADASSRPQPQLSLPLPSAPAAPAQTAAPPAGKPELGTYVSSSEGAAGAPRQAISTSASPPPPRAARVSSGKFSPGVRLMWFILFTSGGAAILAGTMLLPEYISLRNQAYQRACLAHQMRCEEKLLVFNERLTAGMQADPELTTRLLIRNGNYRMGEGRMYDTGLPPPPTLMPPQVIREAATPPPPPSDGLYEAARWVDDRSTRGALMFLALGMIAAGTILFGPHGKLYRSAVTQ